MPPLDERPVTGRTYWRSLDDLADTPEFRRFVENEFPSMGDLLDRGGSSRRTFLKVMGASMALAGMTACRWPQEEIVPFASRPEGRVPGVPERFATAMEWLGGAVGLLVTSFDGRPVKIEGNPEHPASGGATDSYAQAAILELYDPDRSRQVVERVNGGGQVRSWDEFRAAALPRFEELRARNGRGLAVVTDACTSPTLRRLRDAWVRMYPEALWIEYEPVHRDHERDGARIAFGRPVRTRLALADAAVIASFDHDFLLGHPESIRLAGEFARSRRPDGAAMSRLYVAEGRHSLTGSLADRRAGVAPSRVGPMMAALALALADRGVVVPDVAARPAGLTESEQAWVDALAADLAASRGQGAITVGASQPAEVHALAHHLNHALGNVGHGITYHEDPDPDRPGDLEALRSFVEAASAGAVDTVLVLGGNPVYASPADLDVARAIGAASLSIHLGPYRDETAEACSWHLPRAHFLESWSDARAWDGTVTVVQPLIEPLWGGKTPAEILALLEDLPVQSAYELVRETFAAVPGADLDADWRKALHAGVVAGTSFPEIRPEPRARRVEIVEPAVPVDGELELVLHADASTLDGRFANNGWLQELPDPMTKLTWDNAALIAPATADRLGVSQGDLLRVERDGASLDLPVHLMPGQPRETVAVALGYGRARAGRVGDGVGFDAYRLRSSSRPFFAPCTARKAGGSYPLAVTQDHFAIDRTGREGTAARLPVLVREGDLQEYLEDERFVEHRAHVPKPVKLWKEHDYDGYKWGMAIDLNACIGCGACSIACQAENNIPVVGKDEVSRGREMHWIRVDRYFSGEPDAPDTVHQPVACHHCENAPCEQVCPVAATIHDSEGLNVMVYNRCIGTRYCSNNCPYKVRRFNWFNNHKELEQVEKMKFNPEVTVRARGVMEKCTYCVQRISAARIAAKNERRPVRDGEITTACAQACPARAITFGDLNDPDSAVSREAADPRAYEMLEEINVRARTRYLARLRNRGEGSGHSGGGHHES